MSEPGARFRLALLIALGAAGLAGANALSAHAAPESGRQIGGMALEILGSALLALGLTRLLLPRVERLWSRDLRVAAQAVRLILLLGLVAVSGFGLWLGLTDLRELRLLQAGGRTTDAQIITIQTVGVAASLHLVGYAFRVGPNVVTGQMELSRTELKGLRMGAPLIVTYLPSQPQTYRLGPVGGDRVRRRGLLVALFILRGFAWFGLPFLTIERQRRLLKTAPLPGRAVPAEQGGA